MRAAADGRARLGALRRGLGPTPLEGLPAVLRKAHGQVSGAPAEARLPLRGGGARERGVQASRRGGITVASYNVETAGERGKERARRDLENMRKQKSLVKVPADDTGRNWKN